MIRLILNPSLIISALSLSFVAAFSCHSMDAFETKIDTFKSENTTIEIYQSSSRVAYYEMLFKQNFPEIKPLSLQDRLRMNENAFHTHIEAGGIQGSVKSDQEIYFADDIKNNVLVCFAHENVYLGGMVSLVPEMNYYNFEGEIGFAPKHVGKHWLAEIATSKKLSFTSYKASYPHLDDMIAFIEKNISKDQLNKLQVSVISNFYSEHLFHVCRHLKNRGIPLTAAHFPKLALECVPHLNKKFYDPTFFSYIKGGFRNIRSSSSWIEKIALDSHSGDFINTYELTLSFPNQDTPHTISIPKTLPSSRLIEEIEISPKEWATFLYDGQKVKAYKSKIAFLFPKAKKVPFIEAFSRKDSFVVGKVDTGEIRYQTDPTYQTIYATEGVWDCVVLILSNVEYNLMAMCHQPWVKNINQYVYNGNFQEEMIKNTTSYPHLNKMIKVFNKELPKGYKRSTKVTLISYYLSKNLINLGIYLKRKGFPVCHISHNNVVITKQGKIYLDPATVYRMDHKNYDRLTGAHLQARKVAVNQDGEMTENWSYTIVNPDEGSKKEGICSLE